MSDVAIACEGVWKSYRIYHQRSHTLKEKILSRRNRYEEFWALKGIDLEVERGTTTGILGTNGSGKSTLLKTMARILTPNRGSVLVSGTMASLLELGIGFHPELTGSENVYLSGSLMGRSRREVDAQYDEIVHFAGIESFMDMPVKNYSTGMYARLAFAVAVSVEPEILLVDEVLSVGDESFQMRCFERMAEFRSQGRTVVIVTHSLDTVRGLCSRAVWIDHGEMKMDGAAQEVVNTYFEEVHRESQPAASASTVGNWESKHARIVEVSFASKDGAKPSNIFETGDSLTMSIRYESDGAMSALACGLAVFRADNGAYLFGRDTRELKASLAPGKGLVELVVPHLPLLSGRYLVTVALYDEARTEIYDIQDHNHWFSVLQNHELPPAAGTVHVPSEWRILPEPVREAVKISR